MNTGIADACDLGWKLAAVLRGFAGQRLLSSYDAERRPVGMRNREASKRHSETRRDIAAVYHGRLTEPGPDGEMARAESGTLNWFGFKEDKPGVFGIFDTFDDETGRDAHLTGDIAKALFAKADEYFSEPPVIHKITLIAEK